MSANSPPAVPNSEAPGNPPDDNPLRSVLTSTGQSLWELSQGQKLLVVFLRHAGCTFCRQALDDLGKISAELAAEKVQLVVVSMSSQEAIRKELIHYNLTEAVSVADPQKKLYQHFGLAAGKFNQLMGPKVMWLGFKACILERHGAGGRAGDITQMPGVFLIENGKTLASFRHTTAADRPDYLMLVHQAVSGKQAS